MTIPPIIVALLLALGLAMESGGEPSTPAPSLHGEATWYAFHPGEAAAGPRLREWLGKGWRHQWVKVSRGPLSVTVQLNDWCECPGGDRLIDLDANDFATLAPLGRGVIKVEVSR